MKKALLWRWSRHWLAVLFVFFPGLLFVSGPPALQRRTLRPEATATFPISVAHHPPWRQTALVSRVHTLTSRCISNSEEVRSRLGSTAAIAFYYFADRSSLCCGKSPYRWEDSEERCYRTRAVRR